MQSLGGIWGRLIVLTGLACAGGGIASAYNVPGSSEAMLAPITRMAAADTAALVASCGAETRGTKATASASETGGAAGVSAGDGTSEIGFNVRSSSADFGQGISSSEYDLVVGSACGAQMFKVSAGSLLVGFAVTFEDGEGSSVYDRGAISHTGYGGALLVSWKPGPQTRLYVAGGYSALDFDVSRGDGDVTGQFDATRWYTALGVNTRADFGQWFLIGDAGLQYVTFKADSYLEQGVGFGISAPGFVPGYEIDLFLANAEARLGYRAGLFEPYVLAGFTHDFEDGNPLGGDLGTLDLAEAGRTIGYFGAGFGVPVGGAGSLGLEAVQSYGDGEFENFQVRGRFALSF